MEIGMDEDRKTVLLKASYEIFAKRANPSRRGFSRWVHLLFSCPTFWRIKPAFQCPICGATYRCCWDGYDVGEKINVCYTCAERYEKTGSFWER